MGDVGFSPLNAVRAHMFPRCGDGELTITICTTARRSGHH